MISLLKKLINVQSTWDKGEVEIARMLCQEFEKNSMQSQVDIWEKHANVTLRVGGGSRGALMISSHLDVVPAGEQAWKYPAFEAVEADGRVYGRGAADMKGGISAAVAAICEIKNEGIKLNGELIFSATAGEETDSCGAYRFLRNPELPKIGGIIVTEPTDLMLVNCHRGIFWLKITTKGKTAHGSMPKLGINAIDSMMQLLNQIYEYKLDYVPHPQLGGSTISVNTIGGGKATNVIPDECSVTVDVRTLPGQDHKAVLGDFQELLEMLKTVSPKFSAQIEVARDCPALETDPECEFVRQMCKAAGQDRPAPICYTTDGPIFAKLGAPVVIFGPGKAGMCHQPDEYVEIAQVQRAKELYKQMILEYLA